MCIRDSIKPDVVLYEEGLNEDTLYKAVRYIAEADVLIIAGTSLAVYPAAGLVNYYRGHKLVVINKTPLGDKTRADLVLSLIHISDVKSAASVRRSVWSPYHFPLCL